jgi:hypothetical protein
MMGFFWFFLGLFLTIAALVMIKISTPNEH